MAKKTPAKKPAAPKNTITAVVAVFSADDDGRQYHIGSVAVTDEIDTENIDSLLEDLRDEWHEEVEDPDGESEFIDWLIENKPGFSAPAIEVTYAVLRG